MSLEDIIIGLEDRTDPDHPRIGSPFAVELEGKHWLAATNGHGILIVAMPVDTELPLYDRAEYIEDFLQTMPKGWRRIPAGAIGELCPNPVTSCPACDGSGESKPWKPEITDVPRCDECRGRGRVPNLDPQLMVEIGHGTYNAKLVRWYCGMFPAVGHIEVADVAAHDGGRTLWLHFPGDDCLPRQYVAVRPLDRSNVLRVDWI